MSAISFVRLTKDSSKSIRENVNRFGPNKLYLDGVGDIGCDSLFCRWCRERCSIGYQLYYFQSDAVSAIGFVCFASSEYDIDLIASYQKASVIIRYRERVLIILMSLHLHGIRYLDFIL